MWWNREIVCLRDDDRLEAYPQPFKIPDTLRQELYITHWTRGGIVDDDGEWCASHHIADDDAYIRSQYAFPVCLIY